MNSISVFYLSFLFYAEAYSLAFHTPERNRILRNILKTEQTCTLGIDAAVYSGVRNHNVPKIFLSLVLRFGY